MKKNNIISLSGGKDSTAMLLMMLERNEPIHSVVFFDTGWEFPEMYNHMKKLKQYIWDKYNQKIWTIHPRLPFEYWMLYKPIVARVGEQKGKVHRLGNGWPSPMRRWCTREKVDRVHYFSKNIPNPIQCVGYAADEQDRNFSDPKTVCRFPLIEWGVTEADALQYCFDKGFEWDGLYNIFHRVSCFCCPLQKLSNLKKLRLNFNELWERMLEWDSVLTDKDCGFKGYKSLIDIERRFAEEDRQMVMFEEVV